MTVQFRKLLNKAAILVHITGKIKSAIILVTYHYELPIKTFSVIYSSTGVLQVNPSLLCCGKFSSPENILCLFNHNYLLLVKGKEIIWFLFAPWHLIIFTPCFI